MVAGADRAYLLLRRDGGIDHRQHQWMAAGGMGAYRATLSGYAQRPQPLGPGQSRAAGIRTMVQTASVDPRNLGSARHLAMAHRARVIRLRQHHPLAGPAI